MDNSDGSGAILRIFFAARCAPQTGLAPAGAGGATSGRVDSGEDLRRWRSTIVYDIASGRAGTLVKSCGVWLKWLNIGRLIPETETSGEATQAGEAIKRGFCPSCGAQRLIESAVLLIGKVFSRSQGPTDIIRTANKYIVFQSQLYLLNGDQLVVHVLQLTKL